VFSFSVERWGVGRLGTQKLLNVSLLTEIGRTSQIGLGGGIVRTVGLVPRGRTGGSRMSAQGWRNERRNPVTQTNSILPFGVEQVAGIPFQVLNLDEAVHWTLDTAAKEHLAVNVRLGNAWTVALAHDNASYFRLLTEQGVNFPDGTPVVWFMNVGRPGVPRAGQVRGPSFFGRVLKESVRSGTRHFLLGGSPDTLESLKETLTRRYPGCQIAGAYSPPFAPVDDAYISDCADRVRFARADLVWVGLGTPKQDVVGTALAEELGITTLNVGAAFDFAAGAVREAPTWIQSSGLEWLYRLACEPRRLLRRYVYGNARFLWVATKAHVTRRGRRAE